MYTYKPSERPTKPVHTQGLQWRVIIIDQQRLGTILSTMGVGGAKETNRENRELLIPEDAINKPRRSTQILRMNSLIKHKENKIV